MQKPDLTTLRWLIQMLSVIRLGAHCNTCGGGQGFTFDDPKHIWREARRGAQRVRLGSCSAGHSIAAWSEGESEC